MKVIFLILICILSPQTLSAELSKEECVSIGKLMGKLMDLRNQGVPKERLSSMIKPSKSPEEEKANKKLIDSELRNAIDEMYSQDKLDSIAYMVFKTESCHRKIQGINPVAYKYAYPILQMCSKEETRTLIKCSMRVAGTRVE